MGTEKLSIQLIRSTRKYLHKKKWALYSYVTNEIMLLKLLSNDKSTKPFNILKREP